MWHVWLRLVPDGSSALAQFLFSFFFLFIPFVLSFLLSFLISSSSFHFSFPFFFFFCFLSFSSYFSFPLKAPLFSIFLFLFILYPFPFFFQMRRPKCCAQAEPWVLACSSALARALWSIVTNAVVVTSEQLLGQMASLWLLLCCLAQSCRKYDMVTKDKWSNFT